MAMDEDEDEDEDEAGGTCTWMRRVPQKGGQGTCI